MSDINKVGILTGGGDCPGLNAVIRAVVRKSDLLGYSVIGVRRGWAGLIEGDAEPLSRDSVVGILPKGGTILKTSRTNPAKIEGGYRKVIDNMKGLGIDALIAVGGDDTLGVALKLFEMGVKIVGVPKTIDNDLSATDYTFGFDTAVNIATEAIDRLHSTAESHDRVIVVEVMGRDTGWIAIQAGLAGGADYIVIPEVPFDIDDICNVIMRRHEMGRDFSILVAAEGAKPTETEAQVTQDQKIDAFGHIRLGGIGNSLSKEIEKRTKFETRAVVLGHLQRGGAPSAFDRILATRFGIKAVELVAQGKFGRMAALRGNEILDVDLAEGVKTKKVGMELYNISRTFFG
jgi:6-phosphofructokinase 1